MTRVPELVTRETVMTPLAYRVSDAAKAVGLSETQMWEMIRQGRIEAIKLVGRRTLIDRGELEAFIAREKTRKANELQRARSAERVPPRVKIPGTVYLVACGHHVKIGFTRGSLEKRLKSLRTGAPKPLVVLHEIMADDALERSLHKRWKNYRASGEWFNRCGAFAEWLNAGCPL